MGVGVGRRPKPRLRAEPDIDLVLYLYFSSLPANFRLFFNRYIVYCVKQVLCENDSDSTKFLGKIPRIVISRIDGNFGIRDLQIPGISR